MKIFKDVISGDELFSDTYKIKLVHEVLYEVEGKNIQRVEGDVHIDGANASAEEFDEGTESSSTSGIDIVLNHRLVETGFATKKDYQTYLKTYLKKVVKHLEDNNKADQVEVFKNNIQNCLKEVIMPNFKELMFFTGESIDPDAMICLVDYRDDGDGERPILLAFKHGLDEEKF